MSSVVRMLLVCAAAFVSFNVADSVQAQEVRLEARLTGTSAASGKATFRQRGTAIRLSVEIEDAAPNTAMTITARRGNQVLTIGSITTDATGFADLNRAGANATVLRPGDLVIVRAGTVAVVTGTVQSRR